MTTIARRIAATPLRTTTETWSFISDLLSPAGDDIAPQLALAADAGCMLIAEEHTADDPILVTGCGPQVRIYTLHGTNAIDGSNINEQPLTITATIDWELSIPASGPDYDLAAAALDSVANITVYDPTSTPARHAHGAEPAARQPVTIDLTALEN